MHVSLLPSSFWDAPQSLSEEMKIIHAQLVAAMRAEFSDLPSYGTLDEMVIERACFLYVYIRTKEAGDATLGGTTKFMSERYYKETMQLWNEMIRDLRKVKAGSIEEQVIQNRVLGRVNGVLTGVFDKMNPEVAERLKETFADAFDAADL